MMHQNQTTEQNFEFSAETNHTYPEILTDKAIDFLTELHQKLNNKRLWLLDEKNNDHYLMPVPYPISQSKQQTFVRAIGVQQQYIT
jgi:malate synthase